MISYMMVSVLLFQNCVYCGIKEMNIHSWVIENWNWQDKKIQIKNEAN